MYTFVLSLNILFTVNKDIKNRLLHQASNHDRNDFLFNETFLRAGSIYGHTR